jgi:hypothetical protein
MASALVIEGLFPALEKDFIYDIWVSFIKSFWLGWEKTSVIASGFTPLNASS